MTAVRCGFGLSMGGIVGMIDQLRSSVVRPGKFASSRGVQVEFGPAGFQTRDFQIWPRVSTTTLDIKPPLSLSRKQVGIHHGHSRYIDT